MSKKYRGNGDGSHIMNEKETKLFWYKLYLPENRQQAGRPPFQIKAYRQGDIKSFERLKNTYDIDWWKTLGGWTACECLHDPSMMGSIDELEVIND